MAVVTKQIKYRNICVNIIFIITEDDLSNIYTVEEAVHEIGFGVFQVLLSFFCGAIWVKPCDLNTQHD